MGEKKFHSAKRKRMINNTIVHIVLAVLAAIWIFPIIWVVLTSFRAEKGSYVSTFFPQSFTLDDFFPEIGDDICRIFERAYFFDCFVVEILWDVIFFDVIQVFQILDPFA